MYVHEGKNHFERTDILPLEKAYTDGLKVSVAMKEAIEETYRRRKIQQEYNIAHNITPKTVISSIKELSIPNKKTEVFNNGGLSQENVKTLKKRLELELDVAIANQDFDRAIIIRDQLLAIKK